MWPQGTGEPTGLTGNLARNAHSLPSVTLVLGMVTSSTLRQADLQSLNFLCLNGAAETRRAVAASGNRVIPAHVSAIPDLIMTRKIPVDVAMIRVRPVENSIMFSLGVMVDFAHEMVKSARIVIAEIDERLPLTGDDALIPATEFDVLTIADGEELVLPDPTPSEIDLALARRVAELVPDRATIQLGVGGLPVAVCAALSGHKELGIHSGVIPDAAVDLIESGVVTNAHKGIDLGRTVTGGLFGSGKLFDFAHGNEAISLRRATHTHAARVLAQLKNLHTINSAVEIDISGQVNSELAGKQYVGAVGGQVDFVRAGRLSEGGRSIFAMASTTPDGKRSKIVVSLDGRPITTARSDVDLVVTEFGVADLWGLNLHARARALINVAHPDFRESLEREFNSSTS